MNTSFFLSPYLSLFLLRATITLTHTHKGRAVHISLECVRVEAAATGQGGRAAAVKCAAFPKGRARARPPAANATTGPPKTQPTRESAGAPKRGDDE